MRNLIVFILLLTVPFLAGFHRVYTTDGMVYRAKSVTKTEYVYEVVTSEDKTLKIAPGSIKKILYEDGTIEKLNYNPRQKARGYSDSIGVEPTEEVKQKLTEYFKTVLKDPQSYESISWGNVKYDGNSKIGLPYYLIHEYRAKNSFGGYNLGKVMFSFDQRCKKIVHLSLD